MCRSIRSSSERRWWWATVRPRVEPARPGGAGSVVGGGDAAHSASTYVGPWASSRLGATGRFGASTVVRPRKSPSRNGGPGPSDPRAHLTRAPCGIPTAADEAIVRAEASNTARFGHIARSAGVGEPPPAARALAVAPLEERRERGRLRQGHDRPERQRGAVGVVAVGDPADRVAEDLDRRLRDVLVVVRRAGLPQVLQLPRLLPAGLDVRPRLDAGQAAQRLEAGVRPCPAAEEDGGVGRGSSGMMLLRWAWTTRFIGR